MKTTSCGILIFNAEAELLLCHATGTSNWDIPKGGADPGESTLNTALRETVEETGLRFDARDLLEIGRHDYRPDKDLFLYAVLIERIDPSLCTCTSHYRSRRGRMLPEMDAFEWTPFARVPKRCAKNMTQLLTVRLSLPALLRTLVDAGLVAAPGVTVAS